MEQRPSWDADRSLASQEIPRILWNPKVHYHIYKSSLPVPMLSKFDAVLAAHSTPLRSILILSSHHASLFQVVFFRQVSALKPCMHFYSFPYVLHAPPISVFFIWSPEWYFVRNTERKAPSYVVFSTSLLPRPSLPQISSSAPYSRTHSVYILPSVVRLQVADGGTAFRYGI